jgi:hypothetical protein
VQVFCLCGAAPPPKPVVGQVPFKVLHHRLICNHFDIHIPCTLAVRGAQRPFLSFFKVFPELWLLYSLFVVFQGQLPVENEE